MMKLDLNINALSLQLEKWQSDDKEIALFLNEHLADMKALSPPESKHALDLEALKQDDISFWTVRSNNSQFKNQLLACCALKELSASHGEIKSMRTGAEARGLGLGSMMLGHLIDEARCRKYTSLSLETGSMDFFKPAQALYLKHGFEFCPPFADYQADPNSVFMTLMLSTEA